MGIDPRLPGISSPTLDPAALYGDADGKQYYLFEETYDSVFRDVLDDLAADIGADYDPDAVVWVNKGGAGIGLRIAHCFDEPPVGSLTAESYTDREQGDLDIYDHALDRVSGNVLLVDDIADSGMTLAAVEEYLDGCDAIDRVETATIHVSEDCEQRPTFHYEEVPEDVWVVYEWENVPEGIARDTRH